MKLIEKTEVEGDQEDKPKEGQAFSFAKIWAADRDSLEEIEDNDQIDSWALTLKQIEHERAKEVAQAEAKSGRGHRRAAAVAKAGEPFLPDFYILLNCIYRGRWVPKRAKREANR